MKRIDHEEARAGLRVRLEDAAKFAKLVDDGAERAALALRKLTESMRPILDKGEP